jgi:tryptophan-rich sensory protein
MKKYLPALLFIGISFFAGFVGSIFTTPAIPTWYASLVKPAFSPPNYVFGPVWSILFLLMGISAYLVWKEGFGKKKVKIALKIFFVQLALNTLWSILFFGLKSPMVSLAEIILLWVLIFITIKKFYEISKIAGSLLIPYILWVTFASILNLSIVLLNS